MGNVLADKHLIIHDMEMKRKLHRRFCKNPPKGEQKMSVPKKATTFMEYQTGSTDRRRKVHN